MNSLPDVVVLDTCVLISNVLRRMLLRLATEGCFRVAWSSVIGDEWCRNAARLWKVSDDDIRAQWRELQQAFPAADCGDVTAFKNGLQRSDPKDWHVIAAARVLKARCAQDSVAVLTRNIRDFNRSELRGLNLQLLDPDQFCLHCQQQFPDEMSTLLRSLPDDVVAPGGVPDPVDVILRRERLFRLNRLSGYAV